jgi:hypothetical protein
MGRPVSGDMPIGFAGSVTAGRLSGAGTEADFLRVGLGDGVASADAVASSDASGVAEPDGSPVSAADGEAVDADGLEAGGVGEAGTDGEAAGSDDDVGPDPLAAVVGGAPAGVTVHPASTPAHTRALRAVTGRLTWSG